MNRPDPLSDTLRCRLGGLFDRSGRSDAGAMASRPAAGSHSGPIAAAAETAASAPRPTSSASKSLFERIDWLGGGQVVCNTSGEHYRLSIPLADLWQPPAARRRSSHAADAKTPAGRSRLTAHPEIAALVEHFPQGTVFLDLETCGLAGAAIFLAGLVRPLDRSLQLELFLARDYSEERAMLESLWEVMQDCRVLVTFNGKSFDWPMVRDRSVRHRLPAAKALGRPERQSVPQWHCDLLHHARRQWRGRLPDCRLQTLEWHVCGRRRSDDIPGSQIPEAYRDYVRSGNTSDMPRIMHHNALDLVTLVELAMRISRIRMPLA